VSIGVKVARHAPDARGLRCGWLRSSHSVHPLMGRLTVRFVSTGFAGRGLIGVLGVVREGIVYPSVEMDP
jgi:hypothetical protein